MTTAEGGETIHFPEPVARMGEVRRYTVIDGHESAHRICGTRPVRVARPMPHAPLPEWAKTRIEGGGKAIVLRVLMRALAKKECGARAVGDIRQAHAAGLEEHAIPGGGREEVERDGAAVAAVAAGAGETIRPGEAGPEFGTIGPIDRIFGQRVRRT